MLSRNRGIIFCVGWLFFLLPGQTAPAQHEPLPVPSPTPKELWARWQKEAPPFTYQIVKDEVVASDTDPRLRLRRVTIHFETWRFEGHANRQVAVVLIPTDPALLQAPERRGKVIIVTHPWTDSSFVGNYGDPIAARTGYPTMVLTVPGSWDDEDGESQWLRFLRPMAQQKNDPYYHDFFRSAVPYLHGLDIFADLLKERNIKAIIGGHSKRAFYAYNAAAIDPDRIASVIYMGCERLFTDKAEYPDSVNPLVIQQFVSASVLYIGATNEDGYEMFAINKIQALQKQPWAIEYIPNYRHAANSEKQFMDWQMWVSHVFDQRPLTTIGDLSYEETKAGTRFRAHIDSANTLIQVKAWYVYCDDVPYWRDLVWYPERMVQKEGNLYEVEVEGKLPDAWLVEVKDIGRGIPGYLSSLPQDITHQPTQERESRGSRSRLWAPKK